MKSRCGLGRVGLSDFEKDGGDTEEEDKEVGVEGGRRR